jgi:hypothetical protein
MITYSSERLNDPDGHYPYKLGAVLKAVEENAPAGPEGEGDDRARVRDYMSEAIARASASYVEAQARYVGEPNAEHKSIYQTARDELIAARQRHRANRTGVNVVAVRGAE